MARLATPALADIRFKTRRLGNNHLALLNSV